MIKQSTQPRYQTPQNLIVVVSGLALTAAAFWFRKDFVLHGGGAATVGIIFAYVGLVAPCNWLLAVCTAGATICYCVVGFGPGPMANDFPLTLTGSCLSGLAVIVGGMRYFKMRGSQVER